MGTRLELNLFSRCTLWQQLAIAIAIILLLIYNHGTRAFIDILMKTNHMSQHSNPGKVKQTTTRTADYRPHVPPPMLKVQAHQAKEVQKELTSE